MSSLLPVIPLSVTRGFTMALLSALLLGCGGSDGSDTVQQPVVEKTKDDALGAITKDEVVKNPNTPSTPPAAPNQIDLSQSELAVSKRLNQRRTACGFGTVTVEPRLKQAADNHANYLLHMAQYSSNDFQGHFEYAVDGDSGSSNPYYSGMEVTDRVSTRQLGRQAKAVNYPYRVVTEDLSFFRFNDAYFSKYGDEQIALSSLNSLLAAPYHMASLLGPELSEIGVSYGRAPLATPLQLSNGSSTSAQGSVLELVLASPAEQAQRVNSQILNYPCDGTIGTQYELTHESPNPFGNNGRDLAREPIGQPIYILGNGKLTVSNYKMTDAANREIALKNLTSANDLHKLLTPNQVILMPMESLVPNQSYRVTYSATVNGRDLQNKTLTFTTKAAS